MRYIHKEWGYELIWAEVKDKYLGKILHINKGHRTSLQYHREKYETIMITKGLVLLTRGEEDRIMQPNDTEEIINFGIHRIEALEDSEIFEVSTYHPNDVIRLDDDYNRG